MKRNYRTRPVLDMENLALHATCEVGLEEILTRELEQLGARSLNPGQRGVSFLGTYQTLWKANLMCHTANRVLVRIAQFRAQNRDHLYNASVSIPWSDLMDVDHTIAVDSRTSNSELHQTQFINQVVKDAVCDRFRKDSGRRPNVNRQYPDIPINVHIRNNQVAIHLDSSGSRLHRRGYRRGAGHAPLRETLAAGLVLLSGYDGSQALYDPMCGSATMLIEAAFMARRISPGLFRLGPGNDGFAFQKWRNHDRDAFSELVKELKARILKRAPAPISGSDLDSKVLRLARTSANRAGVMDDLTLEECPLTDARPKAESGILVTNPPYGERVGEPLELAELYSSLGDLFKQHFKGHCAWVIAGDPSLAKRIGLRPSGRTTVFNGPIECRLLRFELYEGSKKEKWNQETD
jgi:putative N6-adenine-specific DNA methylase